MCHSSATRLSEMDSDEEERDESYINQLLRNLLKLLPDSSEEEFPSQFDEDDEEAVIEKALKYILRLQEYNLKYTKEFEEQRWNMIFNREKSVDSFPDLSSPEDTIEVITSQREVFIKIHLQNCRKIPLHITAELEKLHLSVKSYNAMMVDRCRFFINILAQVDEKMDPYEIDLCNDIRSAVIKLMED